MDWQAGCTARDVRACAGDARRGQSGGGGGERVRVRAWCVHVPGPTADAPECLCAACVERWVCGGAVLCAVCGGAGCYSNCFDSSSVLGGLRLATIAGAALRLAAGTASAVGHVRWG